MKYPLVLVLVAYTVVLLCASCAVADDVSNLNFVSKVNTVHSPLDWCLIISSLSFDRCCYQGDLFIPVEDCCTYVFRRNDNTKYAVEAAYCCQVGYWPNELGCTVIMAAAENATDYASVPSSWTDSNSTTTTTSTSTTVSTTSDSGTAVDYNFYNIFIDNVVSDTGDDLAEHVLAAIQQQANVSTTN